MQAIRNQILWFTAASLFLGLGGTVVLHAQEPEPGEVLKGQGLKRSSATWILLGEAVILKDARRAQGIGTRLRIGQQQQQALEMGIQNPKVLIENYRQQIDWLDQRIIAYDQELANLGPSGGNQAATVYHNMVVQERNNVVTEQRRLSALINNLADQRGQFQDMKKQFNAEVAQVRESYMQALTDLRKSVDEIVAKYAEVEGKEEVQKALKDLSASSKIKQKLGPSKELSNAIKWLGRLEGSVQSETVELHREHGVDHVDVMINSKGPVRMVFDTGAGPTTLPAELATRFGLKPTGRTVECEVADGTKVLAKEMIIRTMRIGRLSVKDVTCVVMPKEKGDVAPLLGQSFLQRFDFKYTQGSGRLILTKVEPDDTAATPPGKGTTSKKKRAGR